MLEVKHVLVVGSPAELVEDKFPHLDPNTPVAVEDLSTNFGGGFTYVESAADIIGGIYEAQDREVLESALLHFCKRGGLIYIGSPVDSKAPDFKVLHSVAAIVQARVVDEALELLQGQIGTAIDGPEAFEEAVLEAMERHYVSHERVVFTDTDLENAVAFHEPYRASKVHTVQWCADGSIELDGAILRNTALMGQGNLLTDVLGGKVLTPAEVVGFIANRMALVGPEELVGYGRAFGPGKEDHTNATLTLEGRAFRSQAVVGVVTVSRGKVSKAKPEMVQSVALTLLAANPDEPLFLHQQCKEIYRGQAALDAFRGSQDGKMVTLGGKSTKHARVDAGAYCLYTADGTAQITRKAVIGNFEFANDGSIYAPKRVMDGIAGYLKESVKVVKDFARMDADLISRYFDTEVLVQEGDRIYPGDIVFTLNGIPQVWDSKADYGIVTGIIDFASTKLVHTEVMINAWFEGDCKMRGFGKGLMCPSEAAGIKCSVPDAIIIGAAGIIKDSKAAQARMSNVTRQEVKISQRFCARDWDLLMAKHNPEPDFAGHSTKTYPGLCTMYFNELVQILTIVDPNAIVCDITFMIEASPVGQSVGSSTMTMPQIGFIASLPSGNEWLCKEALPGIIKRTDALAYLHAVAGQIPVEL